MTITGVIFFGDSILAGTGASDRDSGCAKIVKNHLSVPVSLKARNWNTSEDGLKRIDNDVISQPELSHVIILFGNNDCWVTEQGAPKVPIEDFKKNLIEIARRIRTNNQVPIILNLQPIDADRLFKIRPDFLNYRDKVESDPAAWQAEYNQMVESVATELKNDFIDIRAALKLRADLVVAADGLHPNDQGHKIIAGEILRYFKRIDAETVRLDAR